MSFEHIPGLLRKFPQWIAWKAEAVNGPKPSKVPYSIRTGRRCDVTDPAEWSEFPEYVDEPYAGLGFCLCADDPFFTADLDDPGNDLEIIKSHEYIRTKFNSTYQELSPSRTGVHIWGIGKIPSAVKRSDYKVELYDRDRFMTVTGNAINHSEIIDCSTLVNQLWVDMGGKIETEISLNDQPSTIDDNEILRRASIQNDGGKFGRLWTGQWQNDYGSQSEADFALIDILYFYSRNDQQTYRLFMQSALGQRDKAKKRAKYIAQMIKKAHDRDQMNTFVPDLRAQILGFRVAPEDQPPYEQAYAKKLPAGLIADIADFIYHASPYSIPEVAVMGAIGLLSGIGGRSYNVAGDVGLNTYQLLVAPTGAGKSSMENGMQRIINELAKTIPAVKTQSIIGPSEFASGQALVKHIANGHYHFVSVFGEFGHRLKVITDPYAQGTDRLYCRVLLDIYSKSGEGKLLGSYSYSDNKNTTQEVLSPAFSIVAEAEPNSFFGAFDTMSISKGLIPRFFVVEMVYQPLRNQNRIIDVPARITRQLEMLAKTSFDLSAQNRAYKIQTDAEATKMLSDFQDHADEYRFNPKNDLYMRELWTRAHIHAMKMAGIQALRNPLTPVISKSDAEWAIAIVYDYINLIGSKVAQGEIGSETNETKQMRKLYEVIAKVARHDLNSPLLTNKMKDDFVFPKSAVQQRLSNQRCFTTDRMGAARSIDKTFATAIEAGIITEVFDKQQYNTSAKLYRIVSLDNLKEALK